MAIFKPTNNLDEIQQLVAPWQQEGKRIIVTSGCFDLLHTGHLQLFNCAKAQGDILITLVSVDKDVQAVKGPSRPIVPELERAELVSALAVVDHVILHAGDIFLDLLKLLNPYKIVKGGDYLNNHQEHLKMLEAYTQEGIYIYPEKIGSTTELIERCVESFQLAENQQ